MALARPLPPRSTQPLVTLSGYITDRTCPTDPTHGNVIGLDGVGQYCPHHGHDMPAVTKNIWREDEFTAAKSPTTGTVASNGNVKIKLEKPIRRPTKKARRKR